jgi:hypothetical protein
MELTTTQHIIIVLHELVRDGPKQIWLCISRRYPMPSLNKHAVICSLGYK